MTTDQAYSTGSGRTLPAYPVTVPAIGGPVRGRIFRIFLSQDSRLDYRCHGVWWQFSILTPHTTTSVLHDLAE
jgi:hypothetical protein